MVRCRICFFILLSSIFFLAKGILAAPGPNANFSQAVSLFNAKNYQAALLLFQQAVQDDPGNAQAYYYLGSCQETVGDLRDEVLNYYISNKLSPDGGMRSYADKVMDKLSLEDQEWVEKQFAAWKPPAAQAATAAAPSSTTTDYSRAVSLYDAKDYQAALPLFQQVTLDNPRNASAYYYLGSCQQRAGYLRGEVLNFYLSDRLQPYPALKACADKVMEKLSNEDQAWVKSRLDAIPAPGAGPQLDSLIQSQGPVKPIRFGVRISSSVALFNLGDFQNDMTYRRTEVAGFQSANPSSGYSLQFSLSTADILLEVNPYLAIDPNGELGIAFRYWPTTSYAYRITAGAYPQYFVDSEFDVSSFELLLKGRTYFSNSSKDKIRFFIEPGAGLQPIHVTRTYTYANTTGSPSSDQTGENLNGLAFDGIFNMGAAFTLSPNTFLTLSGGYQLTTASGFNGTWSDSAVPAKNGAAGSERLYTNPVTGQSSLLFVPDDPTLLSAFGEDQNAITYSRPLSVDQSGFRLAGDISVVF